MRPDSLLAVLTLSLVCSGAFGDGLFGGTPTPAIDFGDKITGTEVLSLIDVLENKTWSLSSATQREAAAKLPISARYALYERYKVQPAWGLLNIYAGVGSFIEGDPSTGLVAILGFGAYGGAIAIGNSSITPTSTRAIWTAATGTCAAGCIVYGLIRPWFFADERNRSLRSLLFADDPSLRNP